MKRDSLRPLIYKPILSGINRVFARDPQVTLHLLMRLARIVPQHTLVRLVDLDSANFFYI
jgi:hypothetical protein